MLTAEQQEFRTLAREFVEGEIRPHTARWDAEAALDDAIFGSLAELGFLGMRVGEAWGGLALDGLTYSVVLEELARGDAAVALAVAIHNGPLVALLETHASAAQKERWLPRLASGTLGAFALSEPEAGSDAAGLSSTARRTEGGWRLEGRKRWVTNGARAGLVAVFARTPEHDDGIGCFLVEPSADGYRAGRRERTMGLRASETVEVSFDGVFVADESLVGAPDRGLAYALEAIDVGRVGIASQAVGIAQSAFEHALAYAREREQFGRPIARFGAIQQKLAEMTAKIAAARALTRDVAADLDDGGDDFTARAATAKLVASETAMWVTDEAVQIFGGYGYMRDYPVEKLMRDAKGTEIYEGTSEIMRLVVARHLLRNGAS